MFNKILTQKDIDDFVASGYWDHAFFREIYVLNPGFIFPDGTSQSMPDSPPNIGMIILCFDAEDPAIELAFEEVEEIKLSFTHNVQPKGRVLKDAVEIYFDNTSFVRARKISFRILKKEDVLGDKLKYGKYWEELFE